ncbi:ash family protein [Mannheimia indoligenes]|uniref:ash family protein n=1 Tax=Mannheimia indoligenes TaxID=3103145 RepID=UPI002FE5B2F1
MKELYQTQKQYSPELAIMQKILMDLLTKSARSPYSNSAFVKSKASREKLNFTKKANSSTPFNRAFFVRSVRTPQKSDVYRLFSMVERNRHALCVAAFLFWAVSHPVTLYRPNREKFSGSSSKFKKGLHKMNAFAYSFLCAIRTPETDTYQETIVRIIADSEVNARLQLSADYRLVLPRPVAKIRQKSTVCTVQGGIYA